MEHYKTVFYDNYSIEVLLLSLPFSFLLVEQREQMGNETKNMKPFQLFIHQPVNSASGVSSGIVLQLNVLFKTCFSQFTTETVQDRSSCGCTCTCHQNVCVITALAAILSQGI